MMGNRSNLPFRLRFSLLSCFLLCLVAGCSSDHPVGTLGDNDRPGNGEEIDTEYEEDSPSESDKPIKMYGNSNPVKIFEDRLYWLDDSTLHIFDRISSDTPRWKASYELELESAPSRKGYGGSRRENTLFVWEDNLIVSGNDTLNFYTLDNEGTPTETGRMGVADMTNLPEDVLQVLHGYAFSVRENRLYWLVQAFLRGKEVAHYADITMVLDWQNLENPQPISVFGLENDDWTIIGRSPLIMADDQRATQYCHLYSSQDDFNIDRWKLYDFDDQGQPQYLQTLDELDTCCIEPDSRVSIDGNHALVLWFPSWSSAVERLRIVDFNEPTALETHYSYNDPDVRTDYRYSWPFPSLEITGKWLWSVPSVWNEDVRKFCAAKFNDNWELGLGSCFPFSPPIDEELVQFFEGDSLYFLFRGDPPTVRKESLEELFEKFGIQPEINDP